MCSVPEHIIQALGLWSSEAWQIYVQEHPLFLHLAQAGQLLNTARMAMQIIFDQ